MLERLTKRAKIYGDSLKADLSNKLETTSIHQKKESLKRDLDKAYAEFGKTAFSLFSENMPEELVEGRNIIQNLMEQLEACDAQTDEVNRKLENTKKTIQERRQEIAEQERQEKEGKGAVSQEAAAGVICPHCKSINDDDAVFCVHCGQKIELPEEPAEEIMEPTEESPEAPAALEEAKEVSTEPEKTEEDPQKDVL